MTSRGWIAIAAGMLIGFAVGSLLAPPHGGVRAAIAGGAAVLLFLRLRHVWRRRRRPPAE